MRYLQFTSLAEQEQGEYEKLLKSYEKRMLPICMQKEEMRVNSDTPEAMHRDRDLAVGGS